jgi:uncharacterized protein YjbI with pentapeptide repeats
MSARPIQTLLFYFSGHGISKGNEVYLATPQIDPKNPFNEGFALSDLTKLMSLCKSKQIVSIIDACHSGAAYIINRPKAAKEDANRALAVYDKIGKRIPKAKGISLLLSSQDYESSFAPANHNNDNSLYTKYLIPALGGVKPSIDKEGRYIPYTGSVDEYGDITPNSLHEYVYNKVASENEEQTPRFTSSTSGKIVILHYPDLAAKPKDLTIHEQLVNLLDAGKITDFNNLREKNQDIIFDLSGINLNKAYLVQANLKETNFFKANLEGANLTECNFSEANLKGAKLPYLDLSETNLEQTNLTRTNLEGAKLINARLQHVELEDAFLQETNLDGAHLEGANLKRTNLEGSSMRKTHLEAANLEDAFLKGARLYMTNLKEAKLQGIDFTFVDFRDLNLEGAGILEAVLEGANLDGSILDKCTIRGSNLQRAKITNSVFSGLHISDSNLQYSDLSSSILSDVKIDGIVNLNNSNLKGAILNDLYIFGILNLNGAYIDDAIINAISDISISSESKGIFQFPTDNKGATININSWSIF